jgi:hypothetical protein
MNYAKLQFAIKQMHACESDHVSTVPVRESFNGAIVWEGEVEVFRLRGHPDADTCYAWAYQDDNGRTQYTAVLKLPPVKTPQDAVRAAIVAQVKDANKET